MEACTFLHTSVWKVFLFQLFLTQKCIAFGTHNGHAFLPALLLLGHLVSHSMHPSSPDSSERAFTKCDLLHGKGCHTKQQWVEEMGKEDAKCSQSVLWMQNKHSSNSLLRKNKKRTPPQHIQPTHTCKTCWIAPSSTIPCPVCRRRCVQQNM